MKRDHPRFLSVLLGSAAGLALVAAAAPQAWAQTEPQAQTEQATPQSAPQQHIDERGFDNVAGAINEIPAFGTPIDQFGGQASQSIGQNFANAFNLGSQRTLVLINGRRTVGQNTPGIGSGAAPGLQVDLNIIPTALIDRVETIFTGGAPIYGTDAIAGTINIILKKDFEGFSAEAQYGIDQRGTGSDFRVRGLWGAIPLTARAT